MPSAALDKIRDQHLALYRQLQGELQSVSNPFGGNTNEKNTFIKGVSSLFSDIEKEAESASTTISEYDWLRSTLADWQFALSSILGVSAAVPILQYPKHLMQQNIDNRVWRFLEKQAYRASEERKDRKFRRIFGEAWGQANEWDEAEHLADWVSAEIFLASDIISGKGAFWEDIAQVPEPERWKYLTTTVYDILQKVWLHDVLKAHAYEKWREAGARMSGHRDAHDHFQQATIEFKHWTRGWARKFQTLEAKQFLLEYLRQKFSFNEAGEIDLWTKNVQDLVKAKAERISLSGSMDADENWFTAESYVKKYYNSVYSNLLSDDWKNTKVISDAFSMGESLASRTSIINAFEAAILLYYIKGVNLN